MVEEQSMSLSDAELAQAYERFQMLRPFLEQGVPLTQVIKHHALSLRTARRWVMRYRAHGLAGLNRRARSDRGIPRVISPEMQKLIEGLALRRSPLTAAAIHRQVRALARERGEAVPSYRSVHALISAIDPALVVLAHEEGPQRSP
jgi:putative transposase